MSFVRYYKIWFILSGVILAIGIAFLAIFGLRFGIDFTGGSLVEIAFTERVPANQELAEVLASAGIAEPSIQSVGDKSFLIKTKELSQNQHEAMQMTLTEKIGQFEEKRFESIGPVIGKELRAKAGWQLLLVSVGILIYIAYAFRGVRSRTRRGKVLSGWRMGIAAIVALVHDLFIVIGIFAILGHFLDVEIDILFVTALLTVLGFSVHDTIVVFDRIRENARKELVASLADIIDRSISQTIVRSINTSMTVIFVLLALLLFGDVSIRYFTLALLIGIVAGTYSSIFIASPLLLVWHRLRDGSV